MQFRFLGENTRRLRVARRLSQAALGERLVPRRRQTAISNIELGRLPPDDAARQQLLATLAAAFKVPARALLSRPTRVRSMPREDRAS